MKLLVCAKTVAQIVDEVELSADGCEILPDVLETVANEWDLAAAEEALRLRDEFGGEVVGVTCGGAAEEKALRRCLAMGADRGVRVEPNGRDPLSVAHALAGVVADEAPDLVLCGVQSADAVQAATGTMLAALAGLPCVAVVRRLELDPEGRRAVADRELEGGVVVQMEVDMPAVVTIQTGGNRPRYANLRALKQAERAEIEVHPAPAAPARAYVIRRLFTPHAAARAEMLDGGAAAVAQRLKELVEERLV